ncbi:MAG: type III polyketide synthase [Phycisphaerales bacterium]
MSRSAVILGLGLANPPGSIEQTAAVARARTLLWSERAAARVEVRGAGVHENGKPRENGTGRALEALYRRSRVRRRASVLLSPMEEWSAFYAPPTSEEDRGPTTSARMRMFEERAGAVARMAAERALADAKCEAGSITHLVTVSCTGLAAPGVDAELIRSLGMSPRVERTNVGFMGCHGAINGMRVASAFARADASARVLVAAVELCSLHYHYGPDPEQAVANAIFADGAASAVVAGDEVAQWRSGEVADGVRLARFGSVLLPESADAMSWRIGNHGFEMRLSARVPELIRKHLRGWLGEWLGSAGVRLEDVRGWVVHPGGPRILDTVAEALSLDAGALADSSAVLGECGNMSSPTVMFIMERLRRAGTPRPWVVLGFGPGLVAEAALVV